MLERYPDWAIRLNNYLSKGPFLPPDYKGQGCAFFAAGAILAMTGHDVAAPYRVCRSYSAARAALRARGHTDHIGPFTAVLEPWEAPALARPGDLVVLARKGLGVMQGRFIYAWTIRGIALVEAAESKCAFKVGQ